MVWFATKKKCDIESLKARLREQLLPEVSAMYALKKTSLDVLEHDQGLDVVLQFTKHGVAGSRKKVSHHIKAKDIKTSDEDTLYQSTKNGIAKLAQIRLDDMMKH